MKRITNEEMKKLFKHKILKHTSKGIVNMNGEPTGFYRTKANRYIEDKYVDLAKSLK